MAEAAYAACPALLGAPRSLSSIFCFLFQRGTHANSAPVRGPQRAQVPQNLKSEAPKSGAPNVFFLHVSVFQRGAQTMRQCGAPKSPSPQNLKSEAPKSGVPNVFFPVSVFQRGAQTMRQCGASNSPSPQNLKSETPNVFLLCFTA
jgi:hypothetical protein